MRKSPCKSGKRRSPKTHRCQPIKKSCRKSRRKSVKSRRKSVKKSGRKTCKSGKRRSRQTGRCRSVKKSTKKSRLKSSPQTPEESAKNLTEGTQRKGRGGDRYKVVITKDGKYVWRKCTPKSCAGNTQTEGPLPNPAPGFNYSRRGAVQYESTE